MKSPGPFTILFFVVFLTAVFAGQGFFSAVEAEGAPQKNEPVSVLRKQAENGDAEAQLSLGVSYDKGEGVPQNYAEAAKWFRKAADQGDPYAQYDLGSMYEEGKGVSRSYEKAYIWFTLAADFSMGELQEDLEDAIYRVMKKLSRNQLMDADRIIRDWRPKKEK